MNTQTDRTVAETKLGEYIDRGRANTDAVVAQVMNQVPVDRVVRSSAIRFHADEKEPLTILMGDVDAELLHHNAVRQVAGRLDIPGAYVDDLNSSPWGRTLLAENLNTLMVHRHSGGTRNYLTRSVQGEVRGFLSDRYRRMDTRPILDSVIGAVQANGGIISDGHAGDTRVNLKVILPRIIEPYPGEYLVYGLEWSNSDFGCGANELSAFMLRLVCLNGLIASVEMRKVHLGTRLDENIQYTQQTYELDTRATASAMKDLTAHLLSEARVDELSAMLRTANENKIDPRTAVAALRRDLTKAESVRVGEIFNSPDVVNLPPGQTSWRLSNAISFLAHETESADRRSDLERIAGKVAQAA